MVRYEKLKKMGKVPLKDHFSSFVSHAIGLIEERHGYTECYMIPFHFCMA